MLKKRDFAELCFLVALLFFVLGGLFQPLASPPLAPMESHVDAPDDAGHQHTYMAPRSGKWPTVRKSYLSKHPTCEACGGTESLTVHHVQPFEYAPQLELSEDNLIVLCEAKSHNCHLIFGHLLNYRSYNVHVREDAALYLSRVKNRPEPWKQPPPPVVPPVAPAGTLGMAL